MKHVNAATFGREVDMLCLLIYTRCIVVYLLQIHISFFSEHTLHSNEIQCNYHHILPQLLFAEIEPCASSGLSSDFLPLCVVSCWHCRRTFNIFLILEELPNIGNRPNSVWEGAKGGTKGGEECDSADNFQLQLRRLGSHPKSGKLQIGAELDQKK
jgi:hypothetical protein